MTTQATSLLGLALPVTGELSGTWGDTVNTASRIEANGEVGKVNISAATYEWIKDTFKCVYRGKIQVKGKEDIDMYFVEERM